MPYNVLFLEIVKISGRWGRKCCRPSLSSHWLLVTHIYC